MLVVPGLFLLSWLAIKVNQKSEAGMSLTSPRRSSSVIPSTPLNVALLLMVLMILVSLWASSDINYSLPKISGLVLGIGAFYAVVRVSKQSRGWSFGLYVLIGIGVAIAMLGVLGIGKFNDKIVLFGILTTRLPRLIMGLKGAESGVSPNELAGALIWVLPVMISTCAALFVLPKSRKIDQADLPFYSFPRHSFWVSIWVKILCLIAAFFCCAVFLLCQSRGAYFGLIVTILGVILIIVPGRWRRYCLALLVLVTIVLVAYLAIHQQEIHNWLVNSGLITSSGASLSPLSDRVYVWSHAIYGIQDFPFTGMGMNLFRKVVRVLYPFPNLLNSIDIGHAHNEFLQAALDLGIPGLIAFITLNINAFWMLIAVWRTTGGYSQAAGHRSWVVSLLVLGLGAGLFGHLVYGMADAVALGAKPGLLFWILLGLIAGLYKLTTVDKAEVKNVVLPEIIEAGALND